MKDTIYYKQFVKRLQNDIKHQREIDLESLMEMQQLIYDKHYRRLSILIRDWIWELEQKIDRDDKIMNL